MTRFAITLCAAAGAACIAMPLAPAQAQRAERTKAGTLDCDISGGIGLIIGSKKSVDCVFSPDRGPREVYSGSINKFGLDLGVTSGGRMVWAVYTKTTARRGELAGNYGGASAEVSLVAGLGANVLVGGSNRTVALQPLSIQGQSGVNIAAGVSELRLRSEGRAR